jgi:nucleoside 2-deoxyribosyltransferase
MSTCFVVMPYSEVFREYYDEIFNPAIEAAGLMPVLAEAQFTAQGMIDQVVDGIRSSKIVIADLTDERPNVFYEMGLAHAMSEPVIILTQREESVPSDLKHYRWIPYKTVSATWANRLRNQLTKALEDVLGVLESSREGPSSLRPASMDAIQLAAIGQRLANLSAFQRVLFDYIRKHIDGLGQEAIAAGVSRGGSELFYRLEQLRLFGLIIAEKVGPYDSGTPTFTYRLSPAAKELFERNM